MVSINGKKWIETFYFPSESNGALSLVDLFSSVLHLRVQLCFWAWRKKILKWTQYRGYSTGNRRWHRRGEAMTERLKPNWWGCLEKGLFSKEGTLRFWRMFSLCLGLTLKKIHWTIYSTAGLYQLNHQQGFLATYRLREREREEKSRVESFWDIELFRIQQWNVWTGVLSSVSSEAHLFTSYSHFPFFWYLTVWYLVCWMSKSCWCYWK